MSSFMVEDKTINQIVSYLKDGRDLEWLRRQLKEKGFDLDSKFGAEKLGKNMFYLNCIAIDDRYGKNQAEEFRTLDYKYRLEIARPMQAYKSLRCLIYQCSEGHAMKHETYKLLEFISDRLAHHIISKLPEYDKAIW